jgi:PAS domain S-box-containing protein
MILDVNDAAIATYGYPREEFTKLSVKDMYVSRGEEERENGKPSRPEGVNFIRLGPIGQRKKDGTIMRTLVTSHEVTHKGQVARFSTIEDITEKERLERAVNQSQRLESLGQLAGGVAHDFNNLIGIILNFALFAKEKLEAPPNGQPDYERQLAVGYIERVVHAGESAARLTHQLLAFARREVMQPQPLNVNQVITEVEPLLQRTLGEHIEFLTSAGTNLWPALMDPGQLEQILTNLAINARDAMPVGGKLRIDCENVDVDETYAAGRPGLKPGRFVRIRVSDTGTGMDEQTLQRVFEPFFTTKPKGQGTGLGLATVYGIVNQAGGHVSIYSEVGLGTRVHVLLPASDEAPKRSQPEATPTRGNASETILVVEDAEDLREITNLILAKNGYHVMSAANGREALDVAEHFDGTIDLLLTDVVMPHMQGKELVERIAVSRPGTRVLYMSGYAEPILGDRGTLERGVLLLEKPFTEAALIAKVEHALHRPLATIAPGPDGGV